MKMNKILTLVLAVVMLVSCLAACAPAETNPAAGLEGTYKITMWLSE